MKTYNDHPLNNCVIKCESIEHGKKIIEFWKKQGVRTNPWGGSSIDDHYGLINGRFVCVERDELDDVKIITLQPEETQLTDLSTLPMKEMMVSDDGKDWEKRVVFGILHNRYFVHGTCKTIDDVKRQIAPYHCVWDYAKELPAKITVTMEEIAARKGTTVDGINIVK